VDTMTKTLDEFSWFVGIYEGEGSMYSSFKKKKHTLASGEVKEYDYHTLSLTIKMTDEDVIARCAEFLGQKYSEVERADREKRGYKRVFRVRQTGGPNGKLRKLLEQMVPHLSKRRQDQINGHIHQSRESYYDNQEMKYGHLRK